MRCYFHLVGPRGEVITDYESTEVTALADARAQALEAVAEYRRGDTTDVRGRRLEVRQGLGSVAFTVALDGPLLGTGDGCDASAGRAARPLPTPQSECGRPLMVAHEEDPRPSQ